MFGFNPDLIKQWFFVGVRYATPFIAAYIAKKTGMASNDVADGIAQVLTGINFIWSIVNKWRYETKLNTALDAPEGATKVDLREIIAQGNATGATEVK